MCEWLEATSMLHMLRMSGTPVRYNASLLKARTPSLRAQEGRPKSSGAFADPSANIPVVSSSCDYSK